MSAEEFWKDDPQLFNSYRISFINKKQREVEEEDYKSWLRGVYIHLGNNILLQKMQQFIGNILAGFTKTAKDTTKIEEYPSKPLREINEDKKHQKEIEKKEKEQNYKKFQEDLVYFGTLKKQYIQKLKGE